MQMRTPRKLTGAALGLVTALALTACGGQQQRSQAGSGADESSCDAGEGRVSIATGNSTGVYFVVGGGLAQLINDETELQATAAETGASVQNIQQLVAGTYDVAFSLADTAANAINGTGSFTEKQPIAALARIHTNYTQVIVRKASGIKDVAGMKGKRVSTGSPKSGTEVIANRLLEAAGLNPQTDVAAQRLDLTKTVDGMKDGSIDALFWSGGLPTPGITDLLTTARNEVTFIDISGELPKMKEISEVYEEGVIPAATYGLPTDTKTIVVPNMLLVRDDLDANLACVLTKTLFDRKPQLEQAVSAAKGINLDTARNTAPVPLNRGAEHALSELGSSS